MRNFLTVIAVIFLCVGLFFFSNIYGYFRFKSYCSSEGGLRVYEPLERNVGWLADNYDAAHMAAQLKYVGFVRFADKKQGENYDLRYLGGDPQDDRSFEKLSANESMSVIYKWKNISESIENEQRLRRFGEEILDIHTSKVLAHYYMFSYQTFNPEHTVLGAPSRQYCFLDVSSRDAHESMWKKTLNTIFKN